MARKKLSPNHGGCWICEEDECDAFDMEWDTYVHLECVRKTLAEDPDHPEVSLMAYLLD